MKTFIVAAAAAMLGVASAAGNAIVFNNCEQTIWVQSYPVDLSQPGELVAVQPGLSFSEPFRAVGSTVKIATTRTLDGPLFFGYSFSHNPEYAYYELSAQWGNPFADKRVTLGAGDGCNVFNCQPNDPGCYSAPIGKKVFNCPLPVDLTARVCA
ncbi:hypothetical protein E4U55_003734 [Claviceps digitariae]|nr:hypothetical protein E4U55_003734 [Claviceps digitariae]